MTLIGDTIMFRLRRNMMETTNKQNEINILTKLDRGIDDMETGRELPLKEAFQKIDHLRDYRRNARG